MPGNKFSNLTPEALVDILLQSTKELLEVIVKPYNEDEINAKRKEAELLHSSFVDMLIKKKANENPGFSLSY